MFFFCYIFISLSSKFLFRTSFGSKIIGRNKNFLQKNYNVQAKKSGVMRSEFLTNMLSLMVSFGTCSCLNVYGLSRIDGSKYISLM